VGFNRVLFSLLSLSYAAAAQGTVPTFETQNSYTLVGHDPAQGGTTTIPSILVPINLSFEATKTGGEPFVMETDADVRRLLNSPVFSRFQFPTGGYTQYADAMLRATFPKRSSWHTLLGKPETKPLSITIPVGFGYILHSQSAGKWLAVVDVEFLQRELFKRIAKQEGKLVIAVTHNTIYYAAGDATVCCSWGTHGIDSATGNSFVLGSFLAEAPAIVADQDVQPLTQQLAEFINDPLHDPLIYGRNAKIPGNTFPAWVRPASIYTGTPGACGGTGLASMYFLLEPTDANPRSEIPVSKPFIARGGGTEYHLENIALLPWYTGTSAGLGATYSFPDPDVLTEPAKPCSTRGTAGFVKPTVGPIPRDHTQNGHKLIGYWVGYGAADSLFSLRDVSPQWDVILVAFSAPAKQEPEGTMQFHTPAGYSAQQFKADIAYMKGQGKKVMISLGGGGEFFSLVDPRNIPHFVSSVAQIVSEYGFDGIDLDFETPSLVLDPGDTDFRHPTTPSIVNLISALRQLREHFGPAFLISLVPEGTQMPAGYRSYGGQFGTYLPLTYGIRDILSFIDVQDYNAPPLEGLDGEIYQLSSVDYHAAMTELLLNGFYVGGNPNQFFPPLPAGKVAVGFLTGETTPGIVSEAMRYLVTGEAPRGATYKLRKPGGYRDMTGAMFWTIDADRRANYKFSNIVGPELHSFPGRH
jgi:chitinase